VSETAESFIELIDELLRSRGRLLATTADFGSDSGLTGSQMLVLTAVVNSGRAPTVPQIARSLGHTRQAVQRLADTLVETGFLETADNPDHRRARLLVATDKGVRAQAMADVRSRAWALRITDGLDAEDIVAATATLRIVRSRLEHDRATPPADPD
jgi:DNA-binding MarR family transcriptional regulator